jgi:uncharacterized membrane protein
LSLIIYLIYLAQILLQSGMNTTVVAAVVASIGGVVLIVLIVVFVVLFRRNTFKPRFLKYVIHKVTILKAIVETKFAACDFWC